MFTDYLGGAKLSEVPDSIEDQDFSPLHFAKVSFEPKRVHASTRRNQASAFPRARRAAQAMKVTIRSGCNRCRKAANDRIAIEMGRENDSPAPRCLNAYV
jgi:hypothetical protein